jgi:lysophospholipid acyltransferase (LPLAT)-like uncharacterized protein
MSPSSKTLPYIAAIPAWFFIQLTGRTNHLKIDGPDYYTWMREKKGPFLFSLWHSRLMIPIYPFRNTDIAVIVSQSKDGEYITQLMKRFQIHATRGSASRHGMEGLLGLARWLHQGKNALITPDGPRGPRERVQPGIVQLAKLSGVPVVPVSFSCTRRYRFASWDRFMLPLPFGTIHMAIGDPIEVPRHIDQDGFEEKRQLIEREMWWVTKLADQRAGAEILEPGEARESQ